MQSEYFPFHALGFHCNPFRVLTEEEWMEVAVLPAELARILPLGFDHLLIKGDAGTGKTTTLLGLTAALKRSGMRAVYEYLPPGQRSFKTKLRDLDVYLLDEFQRLSRIQQERLLSNAYGKPHRHLRLVVSSHTDPSTLFAQHALQLTTYSTGGMKPSYLKAILEKRLTYFAFDRTPEAAFTDEAVSALIEMFGNDLRAMERYLYEVFQRLQIKRAITPDLLPGAPRSTLHE
jgi:replication-associated recombination protein RarA